MAGWDNATLKKLKAFADKGMSASDIGKKLGITKNAVVGKLNRMGWNPKAAAAPKPAKKIPLKVVVKKPSAPAKKAPLAKPVATPKISDKKSTPKSLAMHQRIIQHSMEMANLRADQCRFPIGDPDSERFHFCGKPVFVGKPYCYEHCKQTYQFNQSKSKK